MASKQRSRQPASLLRLTGTEQNINVHRRQREGEIEDRVMEGEEREEEETSVRGKTQRGALKTWCKKKSLKADF